MTIQEEIRDGILQKCYSADLDIENANWLTGKILKFLDGRNVVVRKPSGEHIEGCCIARLERLIEDV